MIALSKENKTGRTLTIIAGGGQLEGCHEREILLFGLADINVLQQGLTVGN